MRMEAAPTRRDRRTPEQGPEEKRKEEAERREQAATASQPVLVQ
jgi:hypothetical protein